MFRYFGGLGWPSKFELDCRVTRSFGKNRQIFQKVAQKVSKPKNAKIKQSSNWKSKISTSNHFWNLKYLQQTMFWHAYLGENVIDLLKPKITQNVAITLGYFIFSKNYNEEWTSKSSPIGEKSPNLVTLLNGSFPTIPGWPEFWKNALYFQK